MMRGPIVWATCGVGFAASAALLALGLPLIAAKIIDSAILGGNTDTLIHLSVLLLVVAIAAQTCDSGARHLWQYAAGLETASLQREVLIRFYSQRYAVAPGLAPGVALSLLLNSAPLLGAAVRSRAEAITAVLRVAALFVAVAMVDMTACAVVFIMSCICALVSWLLQAPLEKRARVSRRANDAALLEARERLGSLREASMWGATEAYVERLFKACEDALTAERRLTGIREAIRATSLIYWAASSLIYVTIGRAVADQTASVGQLTAIIAYLGVAQQPLAMLIGAWSEVHVVRAAKAEWRERLSMVSEHRKGEATAGPGTSGASLILARGVTAIGTDGQTLLSNVDIDGEPGRITAIVGRSGAGKTTLLEVLAGLRPVTAGYVSIGGVPIGAMSVHELSQARRLVFQDSRNMRDLPSSPGDTDEVAARVEALGLTSVGASQMSEMSIDARVMSSGQLHRTYLHRALLSGAPCLLLDEVSGALDRHTARLVWQEIRTWVSMGRHTVLIATHDRMIAEACDRVVVLDKGHVIAQGSHKQLMSTSSYYASMISRSTNADEGSQRPEPRQPLTRVVFRSSDAG